MKQIKQIGVGGGGYAGDGGLRVGLTGKIQNICWSSPLALKPTSWKGISQ